MSDDRNPRITQLPPVPVPLKMKVKLKYLIIELTPETFATRTLPLPVHNFERNILIRGARFEPQHGEILIVLTGCHNVLRCCSNIDKIGVEDIELVPLHNFRGRVVLVVMCLIVFVPLVAGVHTVEETRFTRSILVRPIVFLLGESYRGVERFFVFVQHL